MVLISEFQVWKGGKSGTNENRPQLANLGVCIQAVDTLSDNSYVYLSCSVFMYCFLRYPLYVSVSLSSSPDTPPVQVLP